MRYRIHWSIGEFEDSIIIEGETIEDIKETANYEVERRGLDAANNGLWSEELSAQ